MQVVNRPNVAGSLPVWIGKSKSEDHRHPTADDRPDNARDEVLLGNHLMVLTKDIPFAKVLPMMANLVMAIRVLL